MTTKKVASVPFVVGDYLDTKELVLAYLREILENENKDIVDDMLKDVVRSKYVQSIL
jgi:DNA-binding phage protein